MKLLLTAIAFFLTTTIVCLGQSKDISIGAGLSFHNELFHYNEETKSLNQSFGTGIKLIIDFNPDWGYKIEADYIKRIYENESYNPCYFGPDCLPAFFPLRNHGYHTLEFNNGLIRYLKRNDKWQTYLNINLGTAIDFKSFYNRTWGRKLTLNGLNLFSGSMTFNFGYERKLSEQISLNIEPFVRVLHIQRIDKAIYDTHKGLSSFDSFGIQLFIMHGL